MVFIIFQGNIYNCGIDFKCNILMCAKSSVLNIYLTLAGEVWIISDDVLVDACWECGLDVALRSGLWDLSVSGVEWRGVSFVLEEEEDKRFWRE